MGRRFRFDVFVLYLAETDLARRLSITQHGPISLMLLRAVKPNFALILKATWSVLGLF